MAGIRNALAKQGSTKCLKFTSRIPTCPVIHCAAKLSRDSGAPRVITRARTEVPEEQAQTSQPEWVEFQQGALTAMALPWEKLFAYIWLQFRLSNELFPK